MLADWEKDTWKKVYFNVGKKAIFNYTFDKSEANRKSFELSVGEIVSTTIKMPKKSQSSLQQSDTDEKTTVTDGTGKDKDSKAPKRTASQDPRQSRETEKRKASLSPLSKRRPSFSRASNNIFAFKVFDQDKSGDAGYDSAIDEEREPYYMKLLNAKKLEVA